MAIGWPIRRAGKGGMVGVDKMITAHLSSHARALWDYFVFGWKIDSNAMGKPFVYN